MKRRLTTLTLGVLLLALGAGAATVIGDRGAGSPVGGYVDAGLPALAPAPDAAPAGKKSKKKKASAKQKVSNLVTTNPVEVGAGESVFIGLECPKKNGTPISGGGILPAAPGVEFSALSRFNPNSGKVRPRTFYIAARNEGTDRSSFLASVTCLSGVKGD